MRYEDMPSLIGKRVEIPVHYDLWARGARFGVVVARRQGKPGTSAYVLVRMDHPRVRQCLKLWSHEIEYAKVLS